MRVWDAFPQKTQKTKQKFLFEYVNNYLTF